MGRPECDLEAGARPVKSRGVATGARGKEPRYSIGRWRAALAVALLFAGLAQPAAAQSVTRGPYLQLGTPTSITVKWRTDVATDSVVRYGFSPDSLSPFPPLSAMTTAHEVTLSGLQPNTRYYYAVGSSSWLLAGDDSYSFVTAPVSGAVAPTRIWVVGDSGTANDDARAVRDAYKTFTGTRGTDIWLMLGDNAYPDGTDEQFQDAVFDMYPKLLRRVPLWPTLGNHDGHTADSATQSGPYYDIFTLPADAEAGGLRSGTEAYYSFDYANIHFISLESYETDRSTSGAMMTWLESDLAATNKEWIIAFWHHPPYSKGSHDSDTESSLIEMRENALPILESYGVDIVLSGHSHSYERSFLLDGHYGKSNTFTAAMKLDAGDGREDGDGAYKPVTVEFPQHEGAVYAVAGSSGTVITSGSLNHPAMFISLESLGSMVLDVYGNRLDAAFLDNGLNIRDHFSILKTPDAVPPAIVLAEATEPNTVTVLYAEPPCPIDARGRSLNASSLKPNPLFRQRHLAGRYGATPGLSAATKLAVAHSRQCRRRGRALRAVGSTHASLFSAHQARSPLSQFSSA